MVMTLDALSLWKELRVHFVAESPGILTHTLGAQKMATRNLNFQDHMQCRLYQVQDCQSQEYGRK